MDENSNSVTFLLAALDQDDLIFKPQFSHLQNGNVMTSHTGLSKGLNEIIFEKHLT